MGTEHPDDAAVFRMPGGDLLIQTVDLIAPIVDDPRDFGRVATANSLSDVYAMGGRPLTAMNVVCFPSKLPMSVLQEVLEASLAMLEEAGCLLVGGHTVADDELKFGLSVSGIVEGGEVLSIDRAHVGDLLVLTKPIGTGVVNRALRDGKLEHSSPTYLEAVKSMITLNAAGALAARAGKANAATDITGFGLLGHAAQFARASKVSFEIDRGSVPTFEGVTRLVADGTIPERTGDNQEAYREQVSGLSSELEAGVLFDPQTSGGLLVSLPESGLDAFLAALGGWALGAQVVGRVVAQGEREVVIR